MSQGVECYSCLPKTAWPPTSDIESQGVESEQTTAGVEPPENYPEYYEPSEINNYYYDQEVGS